MVREGGGQSRGSSLVPIQLAGSRPALFCIHWAGGEVDEYRELARCLGSDQPLYGLQAIGLDGRHKPLTSVVGMATHYLEAIRAVVPTGPYFLAGASMGGKIAFEMAQQLRRQGEQVALVALFDTRGPFDLKPLQWTARARLHRDNVRGSGILGALRYITSRSRARVRRFVYAMFLWHRVPLPRFMRNVGQITLLAGRDYHPRSYPGRVVLFRATDHRPGEPPDPFLGWDQVVSGELEIHEIAGDHMSLMSQPAVESVARLLRGHMDRATPPEA